MKVYKFGGASINSIDRIKSLSSIIKEGSKEKLVVVISAMGKTTNALEKVAEAFYDGRKDDALQLFERVKQSHLDVVKYLVTIRWQEVETKLKDIFTEVEWLLHDDPVRHYDYYYDQVVCTGELMSTAIVSAFLEEQNIKNKWIDVRDIIRTDNNFREATINWPFTEKAFNDVIVSSLNEYDIIITQGFIGATDDNESTTLGREGSDYSAAVFTNMLKAESLTIWKDVDAVMNCDPKEFPNAVKMPSLSYNEVIEMAYYGAQVIHPKTIKPLQNAGIPLNVKSFLDPSLPGTVINKLPVKNMPPVIVVKEDQVLITFRSKDFSFVEDKPVEELHAIFNELRVKSNLSQHTAISLLCCFDEHPEKTGQLAAMASELFDVEVERNLKLLTIRHYNEETIKVLIEGKTVVLEQKTIETVQLLLRPAATAER